MKRPTYIPPEKTRGVRVQNLEEHGFSKEQVVKMVAWLPVILSYTAERTNSLLANLEEHGFSKEQVVKMVARHPVILGYTAERTNSLLSNLEGYGFSKEQVVKMVARAPGIFCRTAERTNSLFSNLEGHDFLKEQVITMATQFPAILTCAAERTNTLIRWFTVNTISFAEKPTRLGWSVATLEERRKILERRGHDYIAKPGPLFYGKTQWERFARSAIPA
mgnify:FL=1